MDTEAQDKSLIEKLSIKFDDAWNRHDAEELSECLSEDADFLFPDGNFFRGKEEIKEFYTKRFQAMESGIRHSLEFISIRKIAADVAIADFDFRVFDCAGPEDSNISAGRTSWVASRNGNDWVVEAIRVMVPKK